MQRLKSSRKVSGSQSFWLIAVLFQLLVPQLQAQEAEGPRSGEAVNQPAVENNTHSLIYKVGGKCEDTIRIVTHPTNLKFEWRSKTACPVNIGFGEVFWKKARTKQFIVQDSALYMMVGFQHRDRMLELRRGNQLVVSPWGAYSVRWLESDMLHGRWRTWTLKLTPEGAKGAHLVLRFSPEIGIVSLQHLGSKGEKLGDISLFAIDGRPMEEAARTFR